MRWTVQRLRAPLLALGLVALLAGLAAGQFAARSVAARDSALGLAGASRVSVVDDYFERTRAVTLLASHSAAFANFYRAPGNRLDRIEGRSGDADLMPRVETALRDLESLFPDSIASASFIDRAGAENARVVGRTAVKPDWLDRDRTDATFFDRAFELPYDKVFQSAPYRSESTGEWVVANTAKVNVGLGTSPAIVSFEVTIESFRAAFYSEDPTQQVRVVDLLDGRVVIDSKHPQDIDAPLGRPQDKSLRWVQTADPDRLRTADGRRHAVAHVRRASNVATSWAVVVSTPLDTGPWSSPLSWGPVTLVVLGIGLLLLSVLGHVQHGRSMFRAARRDELTSLANRRAARESAERLLSRDRRGLAVFLFDLDRFKHVNDSLGHHAGDLLLQVIGQRLADMVREPEDIVARLGGDEFVVLAQGFHDEESVAVLSARLIEAVSSPVTIDGIEVSVGVSIGIALAPEHGTDYGTLLQRADIAMYDAKGRRAGWQIYRDGNGNQDRAALMLDADLRRAVAEDELVLHLQPSFSISGGEVLGVEALVRWEHPDRGLLMPGDFVPGAEKSGAVKLLTTAVLALALDQVVQWRERGQDLPVAVNVSAHDVTDPVFAATVAEMLAVRGLPGSSLVLELTETALITDPDAASTVLWELAGAGVRMAVDDFGSGYASLLYLRRFPVTVLKLDRSLVQGLTVDATDAALVRWTIEMAHALGIICIAEGIEDAETLEALRDLGCDQAQGYYLARPAPAGELALTGLARALT